MTRSKFLLIFLFALPAFATNYTVKAGGGGNFTTMAACASQMATNGAGVSDTCTVFAGTYNENVTVPAGSAGNYKIFNVNGTDVVTVLSFTLNSHNKLIGNCTAPAAINTCGFNIQNPTSPGAAPCVQTPSSTTDVYIVNNVMYACANGIGSGTSTSGAAIYIPQGSSFIYIQGNTVSYPAATSSNPVLTGKGIDFGEPTTGVDNVLAEGNDFSHYTLGIKYTSRHSIFRNNTFHDQIETEGSSNKHTDAYYSEQPSNVQYNVIEGNFQRNAVGANAKGTLAQGDTPCSGCTNLIIRYQITSRIGSGVSSNYPTWPHIVQYNNTHVDLNMEGSTSGQDTDYNDSGLTNVALLNNLYYYNNPSAWSNWNSGSCGASCVAGHNLYWCVGSCTIPWNHIYGGSGGNWLVDAGNQHADPKFVNYVSPGSTSNNYHLQASSPAIAAGTSLTTVNGTITSSTSLVVTDATFFQDGYSLTNAYSTVSGDCIAVTTITNHVCITAVNYSTNTLTLASPISATNGDPVWLYSKSDGAVVLTNTTAPDMGALPYVAAVAQLPQNWVNSLEYSGTTTNTISFPSTGTGGAWTCGVTNYGPYTAGSQASLQQAITDAEACRTANSSGTKIIVPAGTSYSGTTQALTLPQTANDTSSNFIELISSTPPTQGQTLCSHGIQDNVAASTQPGIRNLGCNGSAMSYQLGTTITSVSGAFTLANGAPTNTSAYNDLAQLFTLVCTSGSCNGIITGAADVNGAGPHHYAIIGAEIKPQAGLAGPNAPVKLGQGSETSTSQLANHIHISYSYIHGDWSDAPVSGGVATGGPTGANSLPNGLTFSGCIYCSINYSYFDQMLRPGSEGHGVYLGLAQQIKIDHNWIEGQSIGGFGGGYGSNLTIANFVNAQDVEDRANRYTYPYSWILANAAGFCVNGLSCSGNGYVRKNAHEMKVANRYLYDGNISENVDGSGGQSGISVSWKTDNSSGGSGGTNYWILNQNVTMTNGVMRNLCQGASWGFRATNGVGNGGGVTLPTAYALIQNNLSYNESATNPGCTGVSNFGFRVNNNDGNTWAASAVRDASGSTTTLTLTSAAGATQSNMNVGDPVNVTGCTDATFNTPTTGLTLALAGTSPTTLTVVYPNAGTANATTTGCTFDNLQGWPQYLVYNHNSDFVNDGSNPTSPVSTANSSPLALSRNMQFTNSIFVGGGITSTFGEGTRTQTQAFDATSEVFNNTLFPGRDSLVTCPGHTSPGVGGVAACYTEYSASSVASTPTTLYGVPTSYCTGNDPTIGSCVGVLGAMSQGSFPAIMNDWHSYRLCHSGDAACNSKASIYSAGQADEAPDGTDLGVSTSAIDAAQTSTIYSCPTSCGSGPYVDTQRLLAPSNLAIIMLNP